MKPTIPLHLALLAAAVLSCELPPPGVPTSSAPLPPTTAPAPETTASPTPPPSATVAQPTQPTPAVTVQHVAGNVHVLIGKGGNIGVSVGADGILLVDDQFADVAPGIRAALDKLSPGKLKFILNTHWHGDHVGGNEVFGKEATIVAHDNVRKRMSTGLSSGSRTVAPSSPQALPIITFDDSLSVHFNGEDIRAMHFPHGHTDGDIVIFFTTSKVVHLGDHFFSGRFPFVDLDSGGDVEQYAANVKKVLDQLTPDMKVIPGHGPVSTPEDLKAFHQMLAETTELVRSQMAKRKSLEDIQKAGVPEKWKGYGWDFISADKWLSTVYQSLSSKKSSPKTK